MSKILVIDDERSIQQSFKKRLNKEGFDVDVADGWQNSKELIQNNLYDIIFLDIKIPGKNGLEILKEIMKINSQTTVAMITGNPSEETARIALTNGAVEYLEKPINKDVLLKTVYRAIERSKLISEKNKLMKNNMDFQKKIDDLIKEEPKEIETNEFNELINDFVKHRKQMAKELKVVKKELDKSIDNFRIRGYCGKKL